MMNDRKTAKTAAVIAEYNPFHNGHRYHLERTRELTGAERIVAIMSGNFVQRGECAVVDKFTRTRMALAGGADLVLELPLPFACAGAEKFALGGVGIADALGEVDCLSFGTECGDISELAQAAEAVSDDVIKPELDRLLAEGNSFASARTKAVSNIYGPDTAAILCSPNNILAVEYLRAIRRLGSDIVPVGIPRLGAAHDRDETSGDFASATAIRRMIMQGNTDEAAMYMPESAFSELAAGMAEKRAPALPERCERAILARLRSMTREQMAQLPDISEGLENRLYECVRSSCSLNELYDSVKSKRYSHARIRRIVLSAFLGIRGVHSTGLRYIRILGMNERGREILAQARPRLPLISTYRQACALTQEGLNQYLLECHADDLWGLMTPEVQPCGADMTAKLIVTQ